MKMITKGQIQRIHAMLPNRLRHDKELKGDFMSSYTGDEDKRSTKDLSFDQAKDVLYFLDKGVNKAYAYFAAFDKDKKQHMKVLSIARQLGWIKAHEKYGTVVDLEQLGYWIAKESKCRKRLKQLTVKQVATMIRELEKKVNNVYRKA